VEAVLDALVASAPAQWLRFSRWGYAAVNTTHVLGIALLVGAILPLDLRLLGLWRSVALESLARVLVPVAAAGLLLAITTGAFLFIARAPEYAALDLFLVKLALIATGVVHALSLHLWSGLANAAPVRRRAAGAASLAIWIAALVCGRLLAFVDD
jgi:hypothetical protein